MKVFNRKAAMFGLDARIALAIFGALSVISGAALYSAIQNSKATALIADLNEISKAWSAYYLDMGEKVPYITTSSGTWTDEAYKIQNLVTLTSNTWKGPYLSYKTFDQGLLYPKYYQIHLLAITGASTWGNTTHWYPGSVCSSGSTNCYIWVHISGIDNESILKTMDSIIDSSDGSTNGNFRYRTMTGLHASYGLYFKVAAITR